MSETPETKASNSSTDGDIDMSDGNLYTDFSNYTEPQSTTVQIKPEPQVSQPNDEKTTNEQTNKKPNRKDWIDTENPLHCKPCDFNAKDVQEFQDHSLSYKHIKKTAEVLEMKVNTKKDEEKKQPVSFVCQVCECSCNSESAWNSHLLGQKHRKNLEKQGAARMFQKQKMKYGGAVGSSPGPVYNAQFSQRNKPYQKPPYQKTVGAQCANDFAQYKEPLIGLEYVTEIQVTGQNPRYHCKLCDAKFDHNVKFPHLVGAKHRFNVLKEKNPAVAQEIRIGVKKRSELSEKLLDEAIKIEREEGRKYVKTCVEASPFGTPTTRTAVPPLMGLEKARSRINPQGKLNEKFSGMKKNPNINLNPLNQPYASSTHTSNAPTYGRGQGRGQARGQGRGQARGQGRGHQYQDRGRGGRGRGRGNSNSYGRGFNHHNNQQSFSGGFNQQFQPTAQNDQGSLLPREAFRPRSPPRSHSNYDAYNFTQEQPNQTYSYGHDEHQNIPWSPPGIERTPPPNKPGPSHQDNAPQSSSTPKSPAESTKQSLLQNLSDLGKLVSSEEDASIALQVSNALTQALLNYRMQNME